MISIEQALVVFLPLIFFLLPLAYRLGAAEFKRQEREKIRNLIQLIRNRNRDYYHPAPEIRIEDWNKAKICMHGFDYSPKLELVKGGKNDGQSS